MQRFDGVDFLLECAIFARLGTLYTYIQNDTYIHITRRASQIREPQAFIQAYYCERCGVGGACHTFLFFFIFSFCPFIVVHVFIVVDVDVILIITVTASTAVHRANSSAKANQLIDHTDFERTTSCVVFSLHLKNFISTDEIHCCFVVVVCSGRSRDQVF